ncbi:efflux RND transporter periplasmic adaptor subunit [Oscillochloris sp. ZM17-4]|uniref:efflux RND transporter periplasmic adaptor subunit n=1 Tax=Oscillochloris sp. ZM17-4 TaxID=2866714 RepID=UPI001C7340B1|nr:efflux RND transporter periplasmic adaptor subunit [Oscillochloris sp. ZM17-4]MBX0326427.1 efflux RND transporter periplasmic adaptor subunit [Oscillochloris sp. ZM17-4]
MTSVPQPRSGGRSRRLPIAAIVAAVLVVAVIASLAIRNLATRPADPLAGASTAAVSRGDMSLGVSATGNVEPRTEADLAFISAGGRVSQVLVAEGDAVAAQTPLVELDTRQLAAEVAAASANLNIAKADLQSLRDGATPQQIAEAQAQVQAAQSNLTQTEGSVTAADLRAARAQVEQARASLAILEAGPKSDARTRAQTTLTDARAELDRQRSALSAAKEDARAAIEQRANALRDAQAVYSAAYWDNKHVQDNGTDPRTGRPLSDAAERDFSDALAQAQIAVTDAEAAVRQSQVDYETAKQNEISGLASAQARVETAQADLDTLLSGAEADELAAARANLARAEADLARLTGTQRAGAVGAQQANVEAAQARLSQLTGDPTSSDLARAEARVAQAQAQLDQAQIRLDDATLRAPFAGTVAAVNVAPGEIVGGQTPPVTLIDTTRYLVKVTVDEVDIGKVSIGQPVSVLIDALGGDSLSGTVLRVEPLPKSDSAVTAYRVTLEVDPSGRDIKPGMTASATIVADSRTDVLSVPAAAVRGEGAGATVSVAITAADGSVTVEDRPVTVGLRTSERAEILSGLAEGEQVVIR